MSDEPVIETSAVEPEETPKVLFDTLSIGARFNWRGETWEKCRPHHATDRNNVEEFVPNHESVTPVTD